MSINYYNSVCLILNILCTVLKVTAFTKSFEDKYNGFSRC